VPVTEYGRNDFILRIQRLFTLRLAQDANFGSIAVPAQSSHESLHPSLYGPFNIKHYVPFTRKFP
jgi:hypothetical protein